MGSFPSFRPLVVTSLLVAAGCGARTSFRDDSDAGFVVGLDVITVVDVPITKPLDVPNTRPIDVPNTRPVDVFVPPPVDVPITRPVDAFVPISCLSPIDVDPGTTLPNQDTTGLAAVVPVCNTAGPDSFGAPLWYRVLVPGHRTLLAEAIVGVGTRLPSVRIQAACGDTRCFAVDTVSATPLAVGARWTNPGASPSGVLVAVASNNPFTPARFSFRATLVPETPPYSVVPISVVCDDLSAGTVIPSAMGDDNGTTAIPLPIPFPYFGSSMRSWSVSTNGYFQVWPDATGMSAGALGVMPLPIAGGPANMIAPFWDDLEIRPEEMMDVRWRVVDTRDRHLTVQWTNVGFCCGNGHLARVTFQAKLFAGTGAIEFHYCALSDDMRARGAGASIGIQDDTGARGVSAQFRSGDLTPMTAYRFSPR